MITRDDIKFKEKEFNYKWAWEELANPMFTKYFEKNTCHQTLLHMADNELKGLSQNKEDLNIPLGSLSQSFRSYLESMQNLSLAKISRIVYYYGHWYSGSQDKRGIKETWRLSNVIDQILRERLGFDRKEGFKIEGTKFSINVYEGFLRLCFSTPHEWIWEEVGLALKTNFKDLVKKVSTDKSFRDTFEKEYEKRDQLFEEIRSSLYQMEWDTSKFYGPRIGKFSDLEETVQNGIKSMIFTSSTILSGEPLRACEELAQLWCQGKISWTKSLVTNKYLYEYKEEDIPQWIKDTYEVIPSHVPSVPLNRSIFDYSFLKNIENNLKEELIKGNYSLLIGDEKIAYTPGVK